MLSTSSILITYVAIIFFEVFVQVSCTLGCRILCLLLSCEIFILWLSFLHQIYESQIFSPSCGLPFHLLTVFLFIYLFIFLTVFLKERKVLILMKSKLLAHHLLCSFVIYLET